MKKKKKKKQRYHQNSEHYEKGHLHFNFEKVYEVPSQDCFSFQCVERSFPKPLCTLREKKTVNDMRFKKDNIYTIGTRSLKIISKSYPAKSVGSTREDVCTRKGADCEESKGEAVFDSYIP